MSKFEEYQSKYKHVTMERRDGIIQMTLHSEGRPAQMGRSAARGVVVRL